MAADVLTDLIRQVNSLQRQVDGLIKPEVPQWADYTPTLFQAATIASTVNNGKYIVIADLVVLWVNMTANAAGTAGNRIEIRGQPYNFAFTTGRVAVGSFIYGKGTTNYTGTMDVFGNTNGMVLNVGGGAVSPFLGSNPSIAVASNDTISFLVAYQRA